MADQEADVKCQHNPMNVKLGYLNHHSWMKRQYAKGLRQRRCQECNKYFFPQEWKKEETDG